MTSEVIIVARKIALSVRDKKMKSQKNLICICLAALFLGPGICLPLRAQSDSRRIENRFLLIFDTSSAMKKRVPNEIKAVNALFEITLNSKLRPGDSVGIWTFSQDLHLGQFPQQEWTEDKVNSLPPAIGAFLKKQHYGKETRFDGLVQTLNEVVKTSPRLTTLIFCDGNGEVQGIPGAPTINASFKQHQHDMEKAHMPFVIVLRSQYDQNMVGHYVGCTISSAESVSLPEFPPFPQPPPPPAQPVRTVPEPPPVVAQPLIVIGTHSETNAAPATPAQQQPVPTLAPTPSLPAPTNPVPAPQVRPNPPQAQSPPTASAPPAVPLTETNPLPPAAAMLTPTNPPVIPAQQATATPVSPPATAPEDRPESPGPGKKGLLAGAAGLLFICVAAGYFIFRRSQGRASTSLITESLKKR